MVMTVRLKGYSDVHYTHPAFAKLIVDYFKPQGRVLEPFRGGGSFYQHLPDGTDWAEIEEGRDFFDCAGGYDWIVTNPPFSNLTDIMEHAFSIAQRTVLLVPLSKIYSSAPRMKLCLQVAGIHRQLFMGPGRDIGFDIGFPFAAVEFIKGYSGPVTTIDASADVLAIKRQIKANPTGCFEAQG
jgi:hypothetical protein